MPNSKSPSELSVNALIALVLRRLAAAIETAMEEPRCLAALIEAARQLGTVSRVTFVSDPGGPGGGSPPSVQIRVVPLPLDMDPDLVYPVEDTPYEQSEEDVPFEEPDPDWLADGDAAYDAIAPLPPVGGAKGCS